MTEPTEADVNKAVARAFRTDNPQGISEAESNKRLGLNVTPSRSEPQPERDYSVLEGLNVFSSDDDWVEVHPAGVGQLIHVRLGKVAGRSRITGLRIDNNREVTADLLRRIRLGQILDDLLGDSTRAYDPDVPDDALDSWEAADRAALGGWVEAHVPDTPGAQARPKRGTPPSDADLREFIARYRAELARHPRRAMARATKRFPMDRSTGYRWLALARERGLITEGDEDG